MKLSCLLAPALMLVCLPHCMVNGEFVGPKLSGTTKSKGATSGQASTNSATVGRTESNTRGSERSERTSSGTGLPDTKGLKLSPNGLPYTTQAEATAFFASLNPAMLSHVVETSKIVWQASISDHTDMVSPNYYYFGRPNQVQFTSDYPSALPKADADHLALDAGHVVSFGHVLSAAYPTLKKGTPGVVYWLQGNDMRDRASRTIFATLDGSVYVTFDDLRAISFAPGAGPATDWPSEVQNPFVPDAFSGLTNAKHKQTYDGADHEYDACMDKVKGEFQPAFEANDVADIQRETRKNREQQIGEQQERSINQRCGKLARQAHNVELRVTKEAALEQLAFRNSLYATNRERFGRK